MTHGKMRSIAARLAAGAAVLAMLGCGAREATPPAGGTTPEGTETAGGAPVAVANPAIPDDAVRIGEAITIAEAPVTLAAVRANPEAYFEKTLLVEGTAAAVCQAKGCWMTITDGNGEPIWVRWSTGCGGNYAFPKDAAGRHVVLQGSFYPKEISPADAEHLAAESGTLSADEIAGKTFEINATACVLLPDAAAAPGSAAEPGTQAG